jgi:hypothetical protein
MAQAYAKMRGIMTAKKAGEYVSLSAGFTYRRRSNKPADGMSLPDILAIGKANGVPFEAIDKSQKMTDAQIEAVDEIPYVDEVAKVFTDPQEGYIFLPSNIDAIASVVNQGFPVFLMVWGEVDEWNIVPRATDKSVTLSSAGLRHGICGHTAVTYEGEKGIVIDDSWGVLRSKTNNSFEKSLRDRGQRILTEDWISKRVYGAAYIRDLNFIWQGQPAVNVGIHHTFARDLYYGMENDKEVAILQDILKLEGCFPTNVPSTGSYYGITTDAVERFQVKYSIVASGTPNTTGFGRVGPRTREVINSKYQ